MSDALIILPISNGFQDTKIDKLIDTSPYYGQTKELIQLLLDIGVIVLNPNLEIFEFRTFFTNNKPRMVALLLGYMAEGIVVRECNNDPNKNRDWANIARTLKEDFNPMIKLIKNIFYKPFLENPEHYTAIGTGFIKTQQNYPHLFDRLSDRDICWVNKYNDAKELLTIDGIYRSKIKNAGIQLKVSCSNSGTYVTNYFKMKAYYKLYPVVYFDLGNDFQKVRDNLMNISPDDKKLVSNSLFSNNVISSGWSRGDIIDIMLIRGKDIDPALHDELLYYKYLLEKVVSGQTDLYGLSDEKIIMSLLLQYVGQNSMNSSSVLTIGS